MKIVRVVNNMENSFVNRGISVLCVMNVIRWHSYGMILIHIEIGMNVLNAPTKF